MMLDFINEILSRFQFCFSRRAAFRWFVILVTGFMLRSDHLGVTSVIRDLALRPGCYETMLHFFRASSWKFDSLLACWYDTVRYYAPLYKEGNRAVLIGDGVKQAKEGRFMPGVKKLFQESENSSKAQYIFGHLFGGLGVLAGDASKWFCIPLRFNIQDGLRDTAGWEGSQARAASHVVQMVENAFHAACTLGSCLLLLDRYFLSVPALETLGRLNEGSPTRIDLVTKAKKSCRAYEKPEKKPGRGRPRKKGGVVKLKDLFLTHRDSFQETEAVLYGKKEHIRYYCINLLWGQKLYQELRFVLVEYAGVQSILASTDTGLGPLAIIRLYSHRFQIECTFREFKQQLGGFCYHFWTKAMPKLNKYQGQEDRQSAVADAHERKRILKAVQATEGFVQVAVVAMGIVQIASTRFSGSIHEGSRYIRTERKKVMSEATFMDYLRRHFFRIMAQKPQLLITQIIKQQQKSPETYDDLWAS